MKIKSTLLNRQILIISEFASGAIKFYWIQEVLPAIRHQILFSPASPKNTRRPANSPSQSNGIVRCKRADMDSIAYPCRLIFLFHRLDSGVSSPNFFRFQQVVYNFSISSADISVIHHLTIDSEK